MPGCWARAPSFGLRLWLEGGDPSVPVFDSSFPRALSPAANGNTDSLHLLIDSGERADITDVMDIHGQ